LAAKEPIGSAPGMLSPFSRWYWYSHEPKTRIFCVKTASRRAVLKYVCWSCVKCCDPRPRPTFDGFEVLLKFTTLPRELYCGAKPRKKNKRSFRIGPPTVKPN